MSLRAIKKRESQSQHVFGSKSTLFRKSQSSPRNAFDNVTSAQTSVHESTLRSLHCLEQQHTLLGRATRSNPELRKLTDTLALLAAKNTRLVRTKSESDVTVLLRTFTGNASEVRLNGAKSEICLQTISVHSTAGFSTLPPKTTPLISQQPLATRHKISSARSHRDLTQTSFGNTTDHLGTVTAQLASRRRLSECSFNSAYSQRTSALSASALTLSNDSSRSGFTSVMEPGNTIVRVPIIGYEVMEERARFTVYKLRVENPYSNDCWLVLRRYTDFVRLNTKLKQAFPKITLMLPRKKIFGDNFNAVFLDNRVQGLQMFVNSIMSKQELRKCKMVREFFCLDEPPSYSESMEECRAIFEAQEETIAHLKMQINSKNDLILSLQQKLRDELTEKEQLKEEMQNLALKCSYCNAAACLQ